MPSSSNTTLNQRGSIGPLQLIGIVLMLSGLAISGYGGYDYVQQSDAMNNAVEADATITSTQIANVSVKKAGIKYKPIVNYEYQFQGERYSGDSIFPTQSEPLFDTKDEARAVIEQFDEGERVTVHVMRNSPGNSFLKSEQTTFSLEFAAAGPFFMLMGAIWFYRGR